MKKGIWQVAALAFIVACFWACKKSEAHVKTKTELAVIPSIAKLMDEWIEKGFGNSDWTVIAKDSI